MVIWAIIQSTQKKCSPIPNHWTRKKHNSAANELLQPRKRLERQASDTCLCSQRTTINKNNPTHQANRLHSTRPILQQNQRPVYLHPWLDTQNDKQMPCKNLTRKQAFLETACHDAPTRTIGTHTTRRPWRSWAQARILHHNATSTSAKKKLVKHRETADTIHLTPTPQPHKKLNESHKPFDFSTQNMIMGREKIYNYLQAEKNRRLVSDPNTFYVLKHMELR